MRYNKITIDGVEGYYSFDSNGEIINYYSLNSELLTLSGNEDIVVIQADFKPNITIF